MAARPKHRILTGPLQFARNVLHSPYIDHMVSLLHALYLCYSKINEKVYESVNIPGIPNVVEIAVALWFLTRIDVLIHVH